MSQNESTRKYVDRRFKSLYEERSTYIDHWREISEYVQPRRGRFLLGTKETNKGSKKNTKIINNTATRSLRTLRAGLMGGLTSPSRPWFNLTTPDPDLAKSTAVKSFLDDTEKRMYQIFEASNIYKSFGMCYEELGVFGTASIMLMESRDTVVWANNLTAGEYMLGLDHQDRVNTLYREFWMTVGQLAEMFGYKNMSDASRHLYDNNNFDKSVKVRMAIEPNRERKQGMLGSANKPLSSLYWEAGAPENGPNGGFLRKSGFDEFPVMAPRWDFNSGDAYGRGPGMEALGDVKALQVMEKRKAQGVDKQMNPPMVGGPGVKQSITNTLPGGLTVVDGTDPNRQFTPAYQVQPRLDHMEASIANVENRISATFFEDLFRMISQQDDVRSATEIIERKEEKLIMIGPVIEQLQSELLSPVIDRTFGIMARGGLLPPIPEELSGIELKVDYISPLAQAQRMVAVGGIERFAGFVGSMMQMDQSAIDKFDVDKAVDEYGEAIGVPPSIIRSGDDVDEIRASKAQQQAAQMAAQQMQPVADALHKMSQVDTSGDNIVANALGGVS